MPTLLRADRWNSDTEDIDTSLRPNHPQQFTTEDVLQSLDELDQSKEITEYTKLVISSTLYAAGKRDVG